MKINKTVIKETCYVAVGQVCFCAVMLAVYFFINNFNINVFFGAILGCILPICNYFFIGYTVQMAIDAPEENRARIMRFSQSVRLMLIGVIVILFISIAKFDPIATLIPLLFPRITIMIRGIFIKKD